MRSSISTRNDKKGRFFRCPTERDFQAIRKASDELKRRKEINTEVMSLVPDESLIGKAAEINNYGIYNFGELFTDRQALALSTLVKLVHRLDSKLKINNNNGIDIAVKTCLAIAIDRQADHTNSCCTWNPSGPKLQHLFTRQAIPIVWDFAEAQPFGDSVGDWLHSIKNVLIALDNASHFSGSGHIELVSATNHPLPNDSAQYFFTDPPYYDAIKYADLSDFFYVWLKRTIGLSHPSLFESSVTEKELECIVNPYTGKTKEFFEKTMEIAMTEGRRILSPSGIGIIVFAHKSTAGWEAQLQSMVNAGWTITGSWPIDTEMSTRMNAMGTASLSSSIHLVCHPRESDENIGDWRDVLQELPKRIHEWMPRLAEEDIVGADAIFACLGPALEIYSRYSSVEKANGEQVTLKEYLEHVWAAVAKEALNMIFKGADATGFEEDARLTAMWLWTLSTSVNGNGNCKPVISDEDSEESKNTVSGGFTLEYDAARKIAQGLGAHLENLTKLVETKGDKARLLPVEERTTYLFGKEEVKTPKGPKKIKGKQLTLSNLLDEVVEEDEDWGDMKAPPAGTTVLDRIHQSMILFAAGRSEALKRFLVEDGVGRDDRFWRLAQALSALYPSSSNEKRWVDGVLARKKGLGF